MTSRVVIIASCILLLFLGDACGNKVDVKAGAAHLKEAFPNAQTNAYVSTALSAIGTDDYALGLIALQNAKKLPGMTVEQLEAVQEAMHAMTADLLARAAKGDLKAQAALAAVERSRSQ